MKNFIEKSFYSSGFEVIKKVYIKRRREEILERNMKIYFLRNLRQIYSDTFDRWKNKLHTIVDTHTKAVTSELNTVTGEFDLKISLTKT